MWDSCRAWYEDVRSQVWYAVALVRLCCLGPPKRPPAARGRPLSESEMGVGDFDKWP